MFLKRKDIFNYRPIAKCLKQIDIQFNYGSNIANKDLIDEIEDIMGEFGLSKIDSEILEMVRNIKKNGVYTTSKTRSISNVLRRKINRSL